MTKLCRVLLCENNDIRNIKTPLLKLGYSLFLNFFVSLRKSCFPRFSPGYLLTAAASPAPPRLSSFFFFFFLELDTQTRFFWFLLHHYQKTKKKNLTGTPARKLGLILHSQLLCKVHTAGSELLPAGPLGAAERLPLTAPSNKPPFEEITSAEQEEAAGSATHGSSNL